MSAKRRVHNTATGTFVKEKGHRTNKPRMSGAYLKIALKNLPFQLHWKKSLERLFFLFHDIADTAYSMNQLYRCITVDLLAQVVYIDVDNVCKAVESVIPYMICDHRPGQNLVRITHEVFEQTVLFGGQVYLLVASPYLVSDRVNLQVCKVEFSSAVHFAAADQSFNPGKQFGKCERLGKVVVRACFKADYDILYSIFCGKHQNRGCHVSIPELFQEAHSVAFRKHPVQDDQIKPFFQCHGKPFFTIAGSLYDVTLFFKAALDEAGYLFFILNNKYSHKSSSLIVFYVFSFSTQDRFL